MRSIQLLKSYQYSARRVLLTISVTFNVSGITLMLTALCNLALYCKSSTCCMKVKGIYQAVIVVSVE